MPQKAVDVVLQAQNLQYPTLHQIYKRIIHSDLISVFADYFIFAFCSAQKSFQDSERGSSIACS